MLPAYNLATLRQASHTVSHLGGGRTSCPILFDLATKSFAQFTSAASTRGLLCTRQRESKQAYHCNCRTSTFKAPSATTHLSPPTFISIMKSPPEAVKSMQRAWTPNQPGSACVLPPFHQDEKIAVAAWKPILLKSGASATHSPAADWGSWFARPDKNYMAVLVLAWSYILSARWAEIMPGEASLVYTSSMADTIGREDPPKGPSESPMPTLDIEGACPAEARWWAAILAEGQGWKATLSLDGDTLFGPWSFKHQPSNPFLIRKDLAFQNGSAVAYESAAPPSAPRQHPDVQSTWRPSLDKLMTLSCRERGVSSILLSGFYDPSIECNAAAPWLQGSFSAIRLLTPESPAVLGRMLMDRQPNLSPLWVGATIIGLQDEVLRDAWRGMILLDLLSAASSKTIQSFVQEPISDPLVVNGNISRSDQCRLLFFSRKEFHKRLPISPWKPFGENPVGDTDLEVQAHVQCKGHRLRYQGFTWNCSDGTTVHQPFTGGGCLTWARARGAESRSQNASGWVV